METVRFVGQLGDTDAYQVGDHLSALPGLWTGMPAALDAAVRTERRTIVAGTCPECGGGPGDHMEACLAHIDKARKLMDEWVFNVGLYARGRRTRDDLPA